MAEWAQRVSVVPTLGARLVAAVGDLVRRGPVRRPEQTSIRTQGRLRQVLKCAQREPEEGRPSTRRVVLGKAETPRSIYLTDR